MLGSLAVPSFLGSCTGNKVDQATGISFAQNHFGVSESDITEQLIFPEISYEQIDKLRGMNIVICTTANTDEEAKELLTLMGAPFEK